MNNSIRVPFALFLSTAVLITCEGEKGVTRNDRKTDFSGTYCVTAMNLELTIAQTGNAATFEMETDVGTIHGTGVVLGDTLALSGAVSERETFTCPLVFSEDGKNFAGTYQVTDTTGSVTGTGTLEGMKGECPRFDVDADGIPMFVEHDFTQLSKIDRISRFRSGVGHDYSDSRETCRSMKHYYSPAETFRRNQTVEIYSPVTGTVNSVSNDGHGASVGLNNKQIQIRPDGQPAFIIRIFHCDLASSGIVTGKKVQAGELLGYGRLYYDDLGETADCFDIALFVNTPAGVRLVPYPAAMEDAVFDAYVARGVRSRQDFVITREERDADPLECDGETFRNGGHLENWVVLH